MLEVETLMRYIRIFSDLSNQIRYATQKRVLVEIALIKLCRPAMETNLDSVLDRIQKSGTADGRAPCAAGDRSAWSCLTAGGMTDAAGDSVLGGKQGSSTCESGTGGSAEDRSRLESHYRTDIGNVQADASESSSQI